jgi:hypothetical protein
VRDRRAPEKHTVELAGLVRAAPETRLRHRCAVVGECERATFQAAYVAPPVPCGCASREPPAERHRSRPGVTLPLRVRS